MSSESADDAVLEPDELRLDDERVDPLGENRYLVRPEREPGPPEAVAAGGGGLPSGDGTSLPAGATASEIALGSAPEPHGVDITLKTDGELAHYHATSKDVREVFVGLLTWYASQLDDDLSPSEALQVLLATSDLEVK